MGTLRDKLLDAKDLPPERVDTDEWAPSGVPFVYVRGLTAKEREAWEMSLTVAGENGTRVANPRAKNIRAGFVARVLVDENGEREYTDDQVDELANMNAAVIERLFNAGRRLSGMLTEEEIEANPSTGDQEGPSSSDSPSPSVSPTPITSVTA